MDYQGPKRRSRRLQRSTRTSVVLSEVAARVLISVGGIGTIIAVSLILVFLLAMAAPLFDSNRLGLDAPIGEVDVREPLALGAGDYGNVVWSVDASGFVEVRANQDGQALRTLSLSEGGERPSAWAFSGDRKEFALGYPDGRVSLVSLVQEEEYLVGEQGRALAALDPGERLTSEGRVIQRTPVGQLRRQDVSLERRAAVLPTDREVVLLDWTTPDTGQVVALLDAGGRLVVSRLKSRYLMLEDRTIIEPDSATIAVEGVEEHGLPDHLFLFDLGRDVVLVWRDGRAQHYALDPVSWAARLVEVHDLLPEGDRELVEMCALPGRQAFAFVDSAGWLRSCSLARAAAPADLALTLGAATDADVRGRVTELVASARDRLVALGTDRGELRLLHTTAAELLARRSTSSQSAVVSLALTAKEDGLLVLDESGLQLFELQAAHPEANLRTLFAPTLYESYSIPQHKWEATGGATGFEPKLGLIPLILGTLKATFYSMLFGAPLALLAALYTSEFLGARTQTWVKSVMELMASVPSVVLGFMAGLVLAPALQGSLARVLAALLLIPLFLLIGAHFWQGLPGQGQARARSRWRLTAVGACLAAVLPAAWWIGPAIERGLFGGDLVAWLAGGPGGAFGALWIGLLPIGVVGAALARWRGLWFRAKYEWLHLGGVLLAGAGGAALLAGGLAVGGFDVRGNLSGAYVQRNALVVGLVMGFAIVPVIFSLAEDALRSVPNHLRLASLGTGATVWQTALRIVVPTAASGLFSAVMIGFGRAIGETMIVLMAAGNTPIMDFDLFSVFRTISANIAIELPEAVPGSTHYRVLFLSALVLFALTFVVNTAAELVRQRFRRRASRL
ncbi:MAG: hypothetical protein ACYS26_03925 [Planctomycetota bacterium]